MKTLITLLFIFSTEQLSSQIVDIDRSYNKGFTLMNTPDTDPEIFKAGALDILTNGALQASARLVKIWIGEPTGFKIPLYLFIGASENPFNEKVNENCIANLLNPMGGIVNLSFNGEYPIIKPKNERITKLNISFQASGKLINGQDTLTNEKVWFFNCYGNIGLFFQTRAWKDKAEDKSGVFWLQAKLSGALNPEDQNRRIFGLDSKNYYGGYSADLGLDIPDLINLKLGVYQFTNVANIESLKKPIVKFSVEYKYK